MVVITETLTLVFHFTILKKVDGYDDSSTRGKKRNDDDEEF